jgi:hypothetical protein
MATDLEKLRVLVPHWIEHNAGHAAEFRAWAARAGGAGEDILAAAVQMESANEALQAALEKLGGPAASGHAHAGSGFRSRKQRAFHV